jgi:exodeoxyribonuclease VII large subunit
MGSAASNNWKSFKVMSWTDKIYTVSELTREIKEILEEEFPFIWVEGEISNFRVPPSGHFYFTLKDASSQLRSVFFRSGQGSLNFVPEDGLQVLCLGRVSVYAGRGEYQIILERMELKGWGALQLAFERLKEKLQKEGLFDSGRKKPLPVLPRKVAVVTSPTGAAVRDFLRILYRRFENIQTFIFPVLVQGEKASNEIAEAIDKINDSDLGIEVIVLARGGGSIEDLWAFNEERVARAMAESRIPIVSAVGHEVDFTIADFVADLRASTPSAAAEILVRPQGELETELDDFHGRLEWLLDQKLNRFQEKLFHLRKRLADPRRRWVEVSLRLDDYAVRLRLALTGGLHQKANRLGWTGERLFGLSPREKINLRGAQLATMLTKLQGQTRQQLHRWGLEMKRAENTLRALSPWAVLSRGYALARTLPEMRLIREVDGLRPGQAIRVQVAQGALDCRIEEILTKNS